MNGGGCSDDLTPGAGLRVIRRTWLTMQECVLVWAAFGNPSDHEEETDRGLASSANTPHRSFSNISSSREISSSEDEIKVLMPKLQQPQ